MVSRPVSTNDKRAVDRVDAAQPLVKTSHFKRDSPLMNLLECLILCAMWFVAEHTRTFVGTAVRFVVVPASCGPPSAAENLYAQRSLYFVHVERVEVTTSTSFCVLYYFSH